MSLNLDKTFQLLRNERRRELVWLLASHNPVSIREAADKIAASPQFHEADADRIHVSLIHHHVPELAGHDVVVNNEGLLTCGPEFDTLYDVLNRTESADETYRWPGVQSQSSG